ncbi:MULTISPECIES: bifunctional biotin--[acetyl-CoA-carboxylase] ligase/biotin operon repressor BirA [unclassified Neptuniibacter]|uniref:bifunctional biotin--[acetyl-CoA-carboxylase] ligase/biotin operon repressor BirA n=1 Tax=unclassified Neptuniibacter TaxID=2630693 RepID=UPI000C51193B|nr:MULTISPECIES: bifunctional biotin--[acetyl-CoA-carboxylase] ligase/biotin operon repressor BirA [unclassified Neptuniibacter]MAY41801.1 bifunctional biotin--[acetyl-CoA-carboxylase] synthetase/biotin operon repressor [Oceanospirillaceae bacterium]|tara:strand:- start:1454 stop:2425 length:972 start_codon:yes stop_codon:yes gene_type:complete
MTIRSLLSILADGKFHSGRELGDEIGISRSAIWKHMRRLEDGGLEIYSVKGRGYRVPGGLELLDLEEIQQGLLPEVGSLISNPDLQLSVTSTSELAMKASQAEDCHGRLFLAEQQTAGRGRRGRDWVSPYGRNLYFSLVWRFEQGIAAVEGLSLLVGIAIVRAMEKMNIEGVQLKWPNDLLYQGKKLAGILLEVHGEASGQCQVVIGVGINAEMPQEVGAAIDQPWTDLKTIMGGVSRNKLMAEVLNELAVGLTEFQQSGFSVLVDEWQARNAMQEQQITLQIGNDLVEGVCKGVNASGALLLESGEGVKAYHGGEISIQRAL